MKALNGRVVVITGAANGIGAACARLFSASGARLALWDVDAAAAQALAAELGADARAMRCDVASRSEVESATAATLAAFGRVDVLINNAGHSSHARSIRWVGRQEWDSVMAVNLTAVYVLTQAVLPGMLERGTGTIVTVGSLAALKAGLIGGAVYGAAKAAVRNLMAHVHNTLRNRGIRATLIMPAEVDTPILDKRPHNPDAAARATMMQAEDVGARSCWP
jgi:NADP-dependent 3-hydroxy acid dehydrogenase YdfG